MLARLISTILILMYPIYAWSADLSDRNIRDVRVLTKDDTGVYYAGYLGPRETHYDKYTPDYDRYLVVYAIRTPASDGTLFRHDRLTVDSNGRQVPGFQLHESEIQYFNRVLVPALKGMFPNERWPYRRRIPIHFYASGYYFENPDDRNKKPYKIEEAIAQVLFNYNAPNNTLAPNNREYAHAPQTVMEFDHLSLIEAQRSRTAKNQRQAGDQSEVSSLFERHAREAKERAQYNVRYILDFMNKSQIPGIVYKSSEFWEKYPGFNLARVIFEGEFGMIERSSYVANLSYNYVSAFEAVCADSLRQGSQRIDGILMSSDFARIFSKIKSSRNLGQVFFFLESVINSMGGKDGRGPLEFFPEVLRHIAQDQIRTAALVGFLRNEGCKSATVRQLQANLIAWIGNQSPVQSQSSVRFAGAERESELFTMIDAARLQLFDLIYRARKATKNKDEWIFVSEEVMALGRNDLFDHLNARTNAGRQAKNELESMGVPVLWCSYGPTRFLTDGSGFKTTEITFMYAKEWPQLLAMRDAYSGQKLWAGGLFKAVDRCPNTYNDAIRLQEGR